jgi:hypothetical protein
MENKKLKRNLTTTCSWQYSTDSYSLGCLAVPAAAAFVLQRYRVPQFYRTGARKHQCHTVLPNHTILLLSYWALLCVESILLRYGRHRSSRVHLPTALLLSTARSHTVKYLCCYLGETNRAVYAHRVLPHPLSESSTYLVTTASTVCERVKFVPVLN